MRRTRHSRSSGRENALDEFFGTDGLEADPLPRQPDASFPLRPFAASATPDARVEAPSSEPVDPERVYQRALEAVEQSRAGEADALFRELLALEPAHVGGALGLAGLLEAQQDVPGALDALLQDVGRLYAFLALHVVSGIVMLKDVTSGEIATLGGASLIAARNGGEVFVNGVRISRADIAASNGVMHVVDDVILPFGEILTAA